MGRGHRKFSGEEIQSIKEMFYPVSSYQGNTLEFHFFRIKLYCCVCMCMRAYTHHSSHVEIGGQLCRMWISPSTLTWSSDSAGSNMHSKSLYPLNHLKI